MTHTEKRTKRRTPTPFATMISQYRNDDDEHDGWLVHSFDVNGKELPRNQFYAETYEEARTFANQVLDKAHP